MPVGRRNLCPTIRFAGHGDCDGGLRELVAWPSRLLHPLPARLSDAEGAMLEPLGVALHALDLGRVRVGSAVAVFGCGPIGLVLIQLARLAGAATVLAADPLPHRSGAAGRLGAEIVPDADPPQSTVDVAFEVAGVDEAVDGAMLAARPGAAVVLVGIPGTDRTSFQASVARRKGLTIMLSRRMNDTYPRAIRLVEQGRVDVASLVTDRYPLGRVTDAFEAAVARRGLKVMVEPTQA
jgi:L-iditol 2-dehydrogenase